MNFQFPKTIIYSIFGIKNVSGDQINPATDEKLDLIIKRLPLSESGNIQTENDISIALKNILETLQLPRNADTANNADRAFIVNTINAIISSGTLTTLTTLTTLANFNGQQAHQMSIASEINAWYNGQRSTIS